MHRYPDEFRARAVEMYSSGRSKESIAKELGVSAETVKKWIRAAGSQAPAAEGLTYAELLAANRKLSQELAKAKEVEEILGKAAAFFARKTLP